MFEVEICLHCVVLLDNLSVRSALHGKNRGWSEHRGMSLVNDDAGCQHLRTLPRCYQFRAFVWMMFVASGVVGFGVRGRHVAWDRGVLFSIVVQ